MESEDVKCECCGVNFTVERYNDKRSKFYGMYLCRKHRNNVKNNGYIRDINAPIMPMKLRKCDYCEALGANEDIFIKDGKGLCRRHYSQIRQYGKILHRTMFDKNEIIIKDDYAEVNMYKSSTHEVMAVAIIDIEDIEKISKYKWGYDNQHGYSTTRINRKYSSMHQIVMGTEFCGDDYIVDHIDRDGLNNRKSNLRLVDKSVNAINAGLRTSNKSGVTGVSFSKRRGLYRSYINYKGERIELGWFKDLESATVARLESELKYYPEYPPQKELFEKYNIGKVD